MAMPQGPQFFGPGVNSFIMLELMYADTLSNAQDLWEQLLGFEKSHSEEITVVTETLRELTIRHAHGLVTPEQACEVNSLCNYIKTMHVFNDDGTPRYTAEELAGSISLDLSGMRAFDMDHLYFNQNCGYGFNQQNCGYGSCRTVLKITMLGADDPDAPEKRKDADDSQLIEINPEEWEKENNFSDASMVKKPDSVVKKNQRVQDRCFTKARRRLFN